MHSHLELLRRHTDWIRNHRESDVRKLALQLAHLPEAERNFVLRQVEGYQRMRHKMPQLCEVDNFLFPPRISLEQASGAAAASYKKQLLKRCFEEGLPAKSFADLTGGMGIDFLQLAPLFDTATYVDRSEELVELARHNFSLFHLPARCVCAEAEEFLQAMSPVDVVYLDPARRDVAGRKTVLLEDCSPNVLELLPLLLSRCRVLLLKLSTMLDLHRALAQLGCVAEAHVFAERGECKDLLLLCRADHRGEVRLVAANERSSLVFTPSQEQAAPCELCQTPPSGFLYEPDAAVMKLGTFRSLGAHFALRKLHPNSHLYCSDTFHDDFPGRVFRLCELLSFSKSDLKRLRALGSANLAVRNFPQSVAQLRARLKLDEGGTNYLFATTLVGEERVMLRCERC